jgi:DNA-binding NtrC family response regulator
MHHTKEEINLVETAARPRILVVDDEENIRLTLAAILEQEGYVVDVAASQSEALVQIETSIYDAVVTDLRLGDGDGLSIADALQGVAPGTPVIIITGYASLESAMRAVQQRVYQYLTKPSDLDQLKVAIRGAIDRGKTMRQLRERVATLGHLAGSDPGSLLDATRILQDIERLVAQIESGA